MWNGHIENKLNVLPTLELISKTMDSKFSHLTCNTREELQYNLNLLCKRNYGVLYFAFHGSPGRIHLHRERVKLPDDLVARLEGKSSLGRLGLLIHSTAGFIDPGWDGHVTLELSNVANLPITIYFGMKIGQLSFVQLTEPAEKPYGSGGLGSKYQGQKGPTPSRYWKNFEQ